jgi:hypothetical protein
VISSANTFTEKLSSLNAGSAKCRKAARNVAQFLNQGDLSGGNKNEQAQAPMRRHAIGRQPFHNGRIRHAGCATAFGRGVER